MAAPTGTIILWTSGSLPSGWVLCDGTNATPDLRNKFIRGVIADAELLGTGGVSSHTHSMPTTGTRSAHNHGGSVAGSISGASGSTSGTAGTGDTAAPPGHTHSGGSIAIQTADSHSHTFSSNTGSGSNLPTYIKLYYIMKTA